MMYFLNLVINLSREFLGFGLVGVQVEGNVGF